MWKGEEGFPGPAPPRDPPPARSAHAPRRRGEARDADFDMIASSVRSEQKKSKERKIALNAQWTTQEGATHYEQAPWSTVQGQSSADMGAAARRRRARISEQKAEPPAQDGELNGGKDAAASIHDVDAEPRA